MSKPTAKVTVEFRDSNRRILIIEDVVDVTAAEGVISVIAEPHAWTFPIDIIQQVTATAVPR